MKLFHFLLQSYVEKKEETAFLTGFGKEDEEEGRSEKIPTVEDFTTDGRESCRCGNGGGQEAEGRKAEEDDDEGEDASPWSEGRQDAVRPSEEAVDALGNLTRSAAAVLAPSGCSKVRFLTTFYVLFFLAPSVTGFVQILLVRALAGLKCPYTTTLTQKCTRFITVRRGISTGCNTGCCLFYYGPPR